MTTPEIAEARRLADELDDYSTGDKYQRPTEQATTMLRALADELERLRAQVSAWETQLTAIMPADFKDWHENSKTEWPRVTVEVIRALRESEAFWIDAAGRAPAQQADERMFTFAHRWLTADEQRGAPAQQAADNNAMGQAGCFPAAEKTTAAPAEGDSSELEAFAAFSNNYWPPAMTAPMQVTNQHMWAAWQARAASPQPKNKP